MVLPEKARYQQIYSVTTLDTASNEIIVKMVNPFNVSAKIQISFDQKLKLDSTGKIICISSENPFETNSFEFPNRIVPVETPINHVENDMILHLNANSVTLLKIKKK